MTKAELVTHDKVSETESFDRGRTAFYNGLLAPAADATFMSAMILCCFAASRTSCAVRPRFMYRPVANDKSALPLLGGRRKPQPGSGENFDTSVRVRVIGVAAVRAQKDCLRFAVLA
jgi:hypothetical protein